MDGDDYKPRSPDLSAITSYNAGAYQQQNATIPQHQQQQGQQQSSFQAPMYTYPQTSFALPHSSYYQPPLHQSSPVYAQGAYVPPPLDNGLARIKTDGAEPVWTPQKMEPVPQTSQAPATTTGKARKMSTKQQRQPPVVVPRPPAPGDAEGIAVKTKFPVARIKRLVQADEEVGKVAQVTPPVVGKALELFMIQMTLAAVAAAQARGSKRLTAAHIKAAILSDDKFDFLSEIGDRIPEGTAGRSEARERKPKMERATSDDDVDLDGESARPTKNRRGGGRQKKFADD